MAEEKIEFRKTYFESIPSVIPLCITIFGVLMAAFTFLGQGNVRDLPVQYATSAIYVSIAGIAFSFYVPNFISLDPDLDCRQKDRK